MTTPAETTPALEDPPGFEHLLEDSVDIASPPDRVWALVHDVRRMAEWSPQVASVRIKTLDGPEGTTEIGLGTRFTNRNAEPAPDGAPLEWTTHGEIVRWDEGRALAFRIDENAVVWSLVLEPLAGGATRLVQRREAPDGLSELSRQLTDSFMGGQEVFTRTVRAGMRETLTRIKAAAEGP